MAAAAFYVSQSAGAVFPFSAVSQSVSQSILCPEP